MASKKRPLKKFLIIASALILIELILIIFYSSGERPDSFVAAMNTQIASDSRIPPERRPLIKLQLALNDFRVKHSAWPKKLEELVPEYFERVPIDPETGAPFKYSLEKDRYSLGESKTAGREGGKDKLPAKPGQSITDAEQSALVASLDQKGGEETYVYDSHGKRDPFRSHDFSPQYSGVQTDAPLERHSYDELTLTAVLKGLDADKAIVEDPNGKGYTVIVGTPIGNSGGKVAEILDDKLVILETSVEFTGEKRTRTIEMYLR